MNILPLKAHLDNLVSQNFIWISFIVFSITYFFIAIRYIAMSGLFYFFTYKMNILSLKKISEKKLPHWQIKFEVKWSLISTVIFSLLNITLLYFYKHDLLKLEFTPTLENIPFQILVLFIAMVLHDLYYYLTHRALHHPLLFKKIHAVHHKSINPTPWASFSFHPIESVIEAVPIMLIAIFAPIHIYIFIGYLTFMTVSACINHLGFEILPDNKLGRFLDQHLITGTHHEYHHTKFNYNYGLYFRFFDKIFKTDQV